MDVKGLLTKIGSEEIPLKKKMRTHENMESSENAAAWLNRDWLY